MNRIVLRKLFLIGCVIYVASGCMERGWLNANGNYALSSSGTKHILSIQVTENSRITSIAASTESGSYRSFGLFFYTIVSAACSNGRNATIDSKGVLLQPKGDLRLNADGKLPDKLVITGWTLFVLALAAASLLLLFRLKKSQAVQQKLNRMHKELLTLYDHAPCGYHSTDGDGIVTNINATLLGWLGYEKQEVVSRLRFIDLIEGEPGEKEEKIIELTGRRSETIELRLLRKSGNTLPVILRLMPSDGLTNDSTHLLFSTIDNTPCQEALDRIKTLDQELEAFSYSISHDLRAPLRSIDGYSKILQEDYATRLDDEGRRVLSVVMNNAKRMGKLIDDLLDFGRLGRKALQLSRVDMTGMVTSIAADLAGQGSPRPADIQIEKLLPAYADADMMRQVWLNILENALKFTGKTESPRIIVRAYKANDNEVCYEVKDNGVGFDMKYADKLFGVFQRLHKMQDFSGTGVGLAIVKRIISRHGGRVWAEAALNEGATFYFTLPTGHESR